MESNTNDAAVTSMAFRQGGTDIEDTQNDPHNSKHYCDWDSKDVSFWLKNYIKLPQYCSMFGK